MNGSDPVWLKKKELWSIKAKAQKLTTPPLNESAVESATYTSTSEIINQTYLMQLGILFFLIMIKLFSFFLINLKYININSINFIKAIF